ncbi:MAG: PAS domain S-box protein [Deltaproteobacteria bacterium]|nr:MAG: PAS domain S-box protein [Deltaproteobacteria bacterium]
MQRGDERTELRSSPSRARLDFEQLLANLLATFINLGADEIDDHIHRVLSSLGAFMEVDRITLWETTHDGAAFRATHAWAANGVEPLRLRFSDRYPWVTKRVLGGRVFQFAKFDEIPEALGLERALFAREGSKSHLTIPLSARGSVVGALSFATLRKERAWPDPLVARLRLVGEFFTNAFERKRTDERLRNEIADRRRAEDELRCLLEAAPDAVVVSDRWGRIRLINSQTESLFGYARDELVGRAVDLLLPERVRERHREHREAYVRAPGTRSMGSNFDIVASRKDGTEIPVEVSLSPLQGAKGLLVFASIRDVSERKRASDALRESEARLRRLLETTQVIPWEADAQTWRFTYVGPQAVKILGHPLHRWYEPDFWSDHIHPEDRDYAMHFCRDSSVTCENFEFEYRMVSASGEPVWLHDVVSCICEDGRPKWMRGFMIDVSERKRAEQALRDLSGRLIRAQENERHRIAGELHDDVSQRLALLAISVDLLGQSPPGADEIPQRIDALSSQVRELSSEIHRVSHQLHPSHLEELGLVVPLGRFCRELGQTHGIQIDFDHAGVPRELPGEVTLCLYRIAQEALRNVVKHSGAQKARVELAGSADAVRLRVSDSGRGFDVESPEARRGLGLVSMRERLRLVRGDFSIDSQPWSGTRIDARIPLDPSGP